MCARMHETKHKYEALYAISPKFYDKLYYVRKHLVNELFILKNRKFLYDVAGVDAQYRREYEYISREIAELAQKTKGLGDGKVTEESGLFMYQLIRSRKPNLVLETGVANGLSTRIILEALDKNGKGSLVSTEVNEDVGALVVSPSLKSRWQLCVGDPGDVLEKTLEKIGCIDVFLHDSDHNYANMKKELGLIKGKMAADGAILADDIDENGAFLEFALSLNKTPLIIAGQEKCFGAIVL